MPAPMNPSPVDRSNSPDIQRSAALLVCGSMAATLLMLIALGHDGRRVAQLMGLAVPMLAWLAWPVRRAWVHRLRILFVWLWTMSFALDAVTRAYLLATQRFCITVPSSPRRFG